MQFFHDTGLFDSFDILPRRFPRLGPPARNKRVWGFLQPICTSPFDPPDDAPGTRCEQ